MGTACSMDRRYDKSIQRKSERMQSLGCPRCRWEDNIKVNIKEIITWTEFILHSILASGDFSEHGDKCACFIKGWPSERLLASEEGLCCMKYLFNKPIHLKQPIHLLRSYVVSNEAWTSSTGLAAPWGGLVSDTVYEYRCKGLSCVLKKTRVRKLEGTLKVGGQSHFANETMAPS
jgi:hypothetical protein